MSDYSFYFDRFHDNEQHINISLSEFLQWCYNIKPLKVITSKNNVGEYLYIYVSAKRIVFVYNNMKVVLKNNGKTGLYNEQLKSVSTFFTIKSKL